EVADRVVVGSSEWDELRYRELSAAFEETALSDIAWSRIFDWRVALAGYWPGVREQEIRIRGPRAEASLLRGWLPGRLPRAVPPIQPARRPPRPPPRPALPPPARPPAWAGRSFRAPHPAPPRGAPPPPRTSPPPPRPPSTNPPPGPRLGGAGVCPPFPPRRRRRALPAGAPLR